MCSDRSIRAVRVRQRTQRRTNVIIINQAEKSTTTKSPPSPSSISSLLIRNSLLFSPLRTTNKRKKKKRLLFICQNCCCSARLLVRFLTSHFNFITWIIKWRVVFFLLLPSVIWCYFKIITNSNLWNLRDAPAAAAQLTCSCSSLFCLLLMERLCL